MHQEKVGCLDISNVVNNKVLKFGKQQSHKMSNHLISVKSTKSVGKKWFLIINFISWSHTLISAFTRRADKEN